MKFCFLILSAPYSPWKQLLEDCAKQTWLKHLAKEHAYFSYMGKPGSILKGKFRNRIINTRPGLLLWRSNLNAMLPSRFDGANSIEVDLIDSWDVMTSKFLSALNLVNETIDFDFLVKVNTTTYVNVPTLERLLSPRMREIYWGGAISKGKAFTGGWATILSKPLVNCVLKETVNLSEKLPTKYEDEALGIILGNLGVVPHAMDFLEITTQHDIQNASIQRTPFFRIKSSRNRDLVEPKIFRGLDAKFQC